MTFRLAVLIPTFDNPVTIARVVEEVRRFVPDVLVVDDGSAEPGRRAVQALSESGLATVVRRDRNGGKGAAVKTGLRELLSRGYTHALQIDADGQHAAEDVPRFVATAEAHPEAMIAGQPEFDSDIPASRLYGRKITCFWTRLETLGEVIVDPLCGFRVYPIEKTLAAGVVGDAMDFDPEIAVRVAWAGVPVLNLRTRVRYPSAAEGGVSHFRMLRDNVLISWMHTRQMCALFVRVFTRPRPRRLSA